MAIADILNREESEFFSKVFKLEIEYFNRDLNLLFDGKTTVVQSSFDYLKTPKIATQIQKKCVKITTKWEGACQGNTIILVPVTGAKVMCGLMMMMSADEIKENLTKDFSPDDAEIFKEIANQINGSLDNALRENFKFDFHSTLEDVAVLDTTDADAFGTVFTEEGYMNVNGNLSLTGYSDSGIYHYIPSEIIKGIAKEQGIDDDHQKGAAAQDEDDIKRLLIVDDDAVVRKIIRGFLKGLECELVEASNGVEAMQMMMRGNIVAVILDIEMPNMDGIEVCKRIKQNPRTRNVPVVMCSGKSTRENVLAAVNAGARDFIVKPINNKEEFRDRMKQFAGV